MKNYFSLLLSIVLFACTKNDSQLQKFDSPKELIASLQPNQKVSWMLTLPKGSEVTSDNGFARITVPEGYELIGYDASVNSLIDVVGYTCTCSDPNKKCTAFVAGDLVGCSTEKDNPCPKCTGTSTTVEALNKSLQEYDAIYLKHGDGITENPNGLSNFATIKPVNSKNDLLNMPMITEKELLSNEFQLAIRDIQNFTYPEGLSGAAKGNIPKGSSLIVMQYSGKRFYLLIPSNLIEKGMFEVLPLSTNLDQETLMMTQSIDGVDDSAGTIKCSGCSNTCILKSTALGQVKYCDGCNSGCTISY